MRATWIAGAVLAAIGLFIIIRGLSYTSEKVSSSWASSRPGSRRKRACRNGSADWHWARDSYWSSSGSENGETQVAAG